MIQTTADIAWDAYRKNPTLRRGLVRCSNPRCKRERIINGALCMLNGWPRCCGETMELVPHEETE